MAKDDKEQQYDPDGRVGELYGFNGRRSVFTLDKQGGIISRYVNQFTEPLVPARVTTQQHALPLRTPRGEHFALPLGLTVVSGATGIGKSTFLALLESMGVNMTTYLAVEPFNQQADIDRPAFSDADSALAAAVSDIWRARGPAKAGLIAIDSLRGPLFETTGPASKGGIIMPFFTNLTRVSNQLARCGYTVIATVNPMDSDATFTAQFLEKLSASTPCFIEIRRTSRGPAGEISSVSGTVAVRPDRTPVAFTVDKSERKPLKPTPAYTFEPIPSMRDVGQTPASIISAITK